MRPAFSGDRRMTIRRQKQSTQEESERCGHAIAWVELVLLSAHPSRAPLRKRFPTEEAELEARARLEKSRLSNDTSRAFFELIGDGVLLCRIVDIVAEEVNAPAAKASPTRKGAPHFFPQPRIPIHRSENVQYFLECGVDRLGVPEIHTFVPGELVFKKHVGGVLTMLEALAFAAHKQGFHHAWPGARVSRSSGGLSQREASMMSTLAAASVAADSSNKEEKRVESDAASHEEMSVEANVSDNSRRDQTDASSAPPSRVPPGERGPESDASSGAEEFAQDSIELAPKNEQDSRDAADSPFQSLPRASTEDRRIDDDSVSQTLPSETLRQTGEQAAGNGDSAEAPRAAFAELEDLRAENARLRVTNAKLRDENERLCDRNSQLEANMRASAELSDKTLAATRAELADALKKVSALQPSFAAVEAGQRAPETKEDEDEERPLSEETEDDLSALEDQLQTLEKTRDSIEVPMTSIKAPDSIEVPMPSIKHGQFLTRETRLESFAQWPHVRPSPEHLAAGGFFHRPSRNRADRVACFSCGARFHSWENGDDPFFAHLTSARKGKRPCALLVDPSERGNGLSQAETREVDAVRRDWQKLVLSEEVPLLSPLSVEPEGTNEGVDKLALARTTINEGVDKLALARTTLEDTHAKLVSALLKVGTHTFPEVTAPDSSDHRGRVLAEIFSSERDYVNYLDVALNVFYRPLGRFGVVPAYHVNAIFLNLEDIMAAHCDFVLPSLASLLRIAENSEAVSISEDHSDPICIGRFLSHAAARLRRLYVAYGDGNHNSQQTLDTLLSEKKENTFADFLAQAHTKEACKKLRIQDFLIMPIQRICKIPLLLRELIKATPDSHPDYASIQAALEIFSEVAGEVNDSVAKPDAVSKRNTLSFRKSTRAPKRKSASSPSLTSSTADEVPLAEFLSRRSTEEDSPLGTDQGTLTGRPVFVKMFPSNFTLEYLGVERRQASKVRERRQASKVREIPQGLEKFVIANITVAETDGCVSIAPNDGPKFILTFQREPDKLTFLRRASQASAKAESSTGSESEGSGLRRWTKLRSPGSSPLSSPGSTLKGSFARGD